MEDDFKQLSSIEGFFYLLKQKGAIKKYYANNEEVFKLDKDKYNDFDDMYDQVFEYINYNKKEVFYSIRQLGLGWNTDALPIPVSIKDYEEYYLPYIPSYKLTQLGVEKFFIKLYDYYCAPKGSKARENLLKDLSKIPYEVHLSSLHTEHYIGI